MRSKQKGKRKHQYMVTQVETKQREKTKHQDKVTKYFIKTWVPKHPHFCILPLCTIDTTVMEVINHWKAARCAPDLWREGGKESI